MVGFRRRRSMGMGGMRRGGGRFKIMLLLGLLYAGYQVISYYSKTEYNEITGQKQRIGLTKNQEIQLGLQSAPHMAKQHGGLHPDNKAQEYVDRVGKKLVLNSIAASSGYEFDFHLLTDPQTINAFALPGGQVFITQALFSKLQNEDQLAGILGHEIGHVLARHGAQRVAKDQLTKGLANAAVLVTGDHSGGQLAAMIGSVVGMKYGRGQELESDDLGIRLMMKSGYNPEEMVGVMKILKAASGGGRQPEFFSTHPNPENRIEKILESIQKYKNQGL